MLRLPDHLSIADSLPQINEFTAHSLPHSLPRESEPRTPGTVMPEECGNSGDCGDHCEDFRNQYGLTAYTSGTGPGRPLPFGSTGRI